MMGVFGIDMEGGGGHIFLLKYYVGRRCNKLHQTAKATPTLAFFKAAATPCILTISGKVLTSTRPKGLPQRQVLSHHTSVDLK